ncbi:hypothetical protein EYF80_030335 [Liparis tanakae]|uniref:Uncharacterized protein n=1 Tax=Liparis tanakae TaxID=230148 RepID=A0A4Z2H1U1_9TELE|nr:hypothetical protein EYF80_030335 [Liparis tanakae]
MYRSRHLHVGVIFERLSARRTSSETKPPVQITRERLDGSGTKMLLVMLTWLAAMWWMRWGMATLAPPDPPPAPPLPAGEGLSERGDGVPLTLRNTRRR